MASIALPQKKRAILEQEFPKNMPDEVIEGVPANAFVNYTMAQLQRAFNNHTESGMDVTMLAAYKSGMRALRRIVTAWKKYPIIGTDYRRTYTSAYDYRMTAHHVLSTAPDGSLEKAIAKIMANAVDPDIGGFEVWQHTQARIDNLFLAAKKKWLEWYQEMNEIEDFGDYELLDPVLSEDEADTVTYTMQQNPNTLNPPTDPSTVLPQAADVDNELHDSQHIYVTGRVLRNKVDKINYAAGERAAAAKAKADEREAANSTGRDPRTMVRGSDVEIDDDEAPATTPSKKSSSKRRATSTSNNSSPRKRVKSSAEDDEDDEDNTGDGDLIVAADQTKPGGAAKSWLRDEDDWGHNTIIQHPHWQMPTIYREFNQRFANTAFQNDTMAQPDYRSDYVRFPSEGNRDSKKTRDYDIFHRSFQAVRQCFEKFKKNVMDPDVLPPYTWTSCPENLAANLPPRQPPPRPDVFRDPDRTPVPSVQAASAPASQLRLG